MARSSFQNDSEVGRSPQGLAAGHEVVPRAVRRVNEYEHFRAHARAIAFEFHEGILTVTGTLPSFYLKQVLQTILRDMPGVTRIDNRVVVVPCCQVHNQNFSHSRDSEK